MGIIQENAQKILSQKGVNYFYPVFLAQSVKKGHLLFLQISFFIRHSALLRQLFATGCTLYRIGNRLEIIGLHQLDHALIAERG